MKFFLCLILLFAFNVHSQINHINHQINRYLNFAEINEDYNLSLIGEYNIYLSKDNSETFNKINISNVELYSLWFNSAKIINKNTFVVVGGNDMRSGIVTSTDGGSTVNLTYTDVGNTGLRLWDVEYNGSTIIAVGESGQILLSKDDGITWSKIQKVNNHLKSIIYNENQKEWIIGGEGIRLISKDDGKNWTTEIITGTIFSLENSNGKIIEIIKNNSITNTNIYNLNRNKLYTIDSKFDFNQTTLLPNGKLLSFDENRLYLIDTNNRNIYYIKDSIYSIKNYSETVTSICLGKTYALIIGENGAVGKYYFKNVIKYFLPPTFEYDIKNACTNDTLTAIPYFNYGDFYEWSLDDKIVSKSTKLELKMPKPGNYKLSLSIICGGYKTTFFQNIQIKDINFPKFNIIPDSTICYNSTPKIFINRDYPINFITYFSEIYDITNDTIIKSIPLKYSNYSQDITIDLGKQNSTKDIRLKLFDNCTNKDTTFFYHLNVDPQLETSYKLKDSIIGFCKGEKPKLKLFDVNKNLNYLINGIKYNKLDTITINLSETSSSIIEMEINSNLGCVMPRKQIARTIYSKPDLIYSLDQDALDIYDTNHLNYNIDYKSKLSFSINPDYIKEDTIGKIKFSYSKPGEYNVKLTAETIYHCKDSVQQKIFITDSKSLKITPIDCSLTNKHMWLKLNDTSTASTQIYYDSRCIINTEIDSKGNIIQSGFLRNNSIGNWAPQGEMFFIRKQDPNGKEIWMKSPNKFTYRFSQKINNATISFKIDKNDNIISILRLGNNELFIYDSINHSDKKIIEYSNYSYSYYLVKFDKDGKMLFAKEITNDPNEKITDISISENKFYVLGYYQTNYINPILKTPIIIAYDTLGNKLYDNNLVEIINNKINENTRLYSKGKVNPQVLFYSGQTSINDFYNIDLSLRFKKLCDNSFVCCWYSDDATVCPLFDGTKINIPAFSKFIFIYKLGKGIIKCKVLSNSSISNLLSGNIERYKSNVIPIFEVDKNDNIYIYDSEEREYNESNYKKLNLDYDFKILDDTLIKSPFKNFSYVLKLNSNLEKIWINYGYNQLLKGISIVKDTLYLTGFSKRSPILIDKYKTTSINRTNKQITKIHSFIMDPNTGKVLKTSLINTPDSLPIWDEIYLFNRGSILYRTPLWGTIRYNTVNDELLYRVSFKDCLYNLPTNSLNSSCKVFNLVNQDTILNCLKTSENKKYILTVNEIQNLSTINFKIFKNDSIYQIGNSIINGNKIEFETNDFLENFKIKFYDDEMIYDSSYFINFIYTPISFTYDTIMCHSSKNLIKLNSKGTIWFQNNNYPSTEYNFTNSNNKMNFDFIKYRFEYQNKCITNDSIKIKFYEKVKNTFIYDSTMCINGKASIYIQPYKNKHYISYSPELEGRSNEFNLERDSVIFGLYNQGKTNFTIKTIDTNNCEFSENFIVNYKKRTKIIQDKYILKCLDSITLNLLNNTNTRFIWMNSDNVPVNFINSNNTQNGDNLYSVKILEGNNCEYSVSTNIFNDCKLSDLENVTSSNNITIQPNPFTESITLHFEDEKNRTVNIYSQQGALINSIIIKNKIENINLNFLPAGVYFLNLKEDNFNSRFKIVKL